MWSTTLGGTLTGTCEVRRAAEDFLSDAGVDDLEVVTTLLSELLTNAIRHGDPPQGVEVGVSPDRVELRVTDSSRDLPRLLDIDPHRVGGNGMRIIDALADTWGATPQPGGKVVWASVRR